MITICKLSKVEKHIDPNLFKCVSISMRKHEEGELSFQALIPVDTYTARLEGEISKKKFLKKYNKFLRSDEPKEILFNIGRSIKHGVNLCFTCDDNEWKMGYLQEFANYLTELFGVDVLTYKEAEEMIDAEFENLEKKDRKLLKKPDEELSEKKLKIKNKIKKMLNKAFRTYFSEDGEANFSHLDRYLAIEQVLASATNEGIIEFKDDSVSKINADKIKSVKPYITAILASASADKSREKDIKEILKSHDLKLKKKKLKALEPSAVVALVGEIGIALSKKIYG